MSVCNNAESGIPREVITLAKLVFLEEKINEDDLISCVLPINPSPDSDPKKEILSFISFWNKMTLFEKNLEKNTISLNQKISLQCKSLTEFEKKLPILLLELFLSEQNAPRKRELDRKGRSSDFAFTCSWMMMQDFMVAEERKVTFPVMEKLMNDQLEKDDKLVRSSLRFNNLVRWLRYFGFCYSKDLFSPVEIIQNQFDKIFIEKKEMPILEFVKELSALIPVFDGGLFYDDAQSKMSKGSFEFASLSDCKVSPGLSLALETLDGSRVSLTKKGDDRQTLKLYYTGKDVSWISLIR